MAFIIQGQDVAAVPDTQSPWYETDIAILVAGISGVGVLSGCEVTAQGTPDMTVAVASGSIQPSTGASAVAVTGDDVAIDAADTDPRIDLVTAAADGTLTYTAGTATPIVSGVSGPKPAALPAGHVALAMIDVPGSATEIDTAQITDKRAIVFAAAPVTEITDLPTAETNTALVLAPDGTGGVEFRAETGGGGGGLSLPVFRQSGHLSNGGGGPGTLVLDAAPNDGNMLVLLMAAHGGGLSSVTQSNVTWTKQSSVDISAVGHVEIWTGAVGASASASLNAAGGDGPAAIFVVEVVNGTISGLGSGGSTGTNSGISFDTTHPMQGVAAGHLIAFIDNMAGSGPTSIATMSCPYAASYEAGAHGFALGVSTGQDILATCHPMSGYALIEILP